MNIIAFRGFNILGDNDDENRECRTTWLYAQVEDLSNQDEVTEKLDGIWTALLTPGEDRDRFLAQVRAGIDGESAVGI